MPVERTVAVWGGGETTAGLIALAPIVTLLLRRLGEVTQGACGECERECE